MGLPLLMLDLVRVAAAEQKGGRLCSAGYPDLLVSREQLDRMFGPGFSMDIPIRPDSARIAKWHGVQSWLPEILDSAALFAKLGYTLDVVDIHAARGDEIIVDLNLPAPPDLMGRYDLVLDTGTPEHCFHIGQAAMNLAGMVREGGLIIQALPLNTFNHGFYNVNPTWFHSFYTSNGFDLVWFQGVANVVTRPQVFDLPPHARFNAAPEKSIIVAVARRTRLQPLRAPMQYKYVVNPGLQG